MNNNEITKLMFREVSKETNLFGTISEITVPSKVLLTSDPLTLIAWEAFRAIDKVCGTSLLSDTVGEMSLLCASNDNKTNSYSDTSSIEEAVNFCEDLIQRDYEVICSYLDSLLPSMDSEKLSKVEKHLDEVSGKTITFIANEKLDMYMLNMEFNNLNCIDQLKVISYIRESLAENSAELVKSIINTIKDNTKADAEESNKKKASDEQENKSSNEEVITGDVVSGIGSIFNNFDFNIQDILSSLKLSNEDLQDSEKCVALVNNTVTEMLKEVPETKIKEVIEKNYVMIGTISKLVCGFIPKEIKDNRGLINIIESTVIKVIDESSISEEVKSLLRSVIKAFVGTLIGDENTHSTPVITSTNDITPDTGDRSIVLNVTKPAGKTICNITPYYKDQEILNRYIINANKVSVPNHAAILTTFGTILKNLNASLVEQEIAEGVTEPIKYAFLEFKDISNFKICSVFLANDGIYYFHDIDTPNSIARTVTYITEKGKAPYITYNGPVINNYQTA